MFRRDTYEKQAVALTELPAMLPALLEDIQHNMYALADAFRQTRITDVHNMDELARACLLYTSRRQAHHALHQGQHV